jgi:hypothetical protein
MKSMIFIFLALLFTVSHGQCEEGRKAKASVSPITCDFHIPQQWKKVKNNIYRLKSFSKTYEEWAQFLDEGHQPWRLEPQNTAAACLWDFGISDNSADIFYFADRLVEIKKSSLYVLRAENTSYYVFVKNEVVPVAYELLVVESPCCKDRTTRR